MYGLLPSQVRDEATTYDMRVTDAMISWENKQYEESKTGIPSTPSLSQEEMKAMLQKVKEKNNG